MKVDFFELYHYDKLNEKTCREEMEKLFPDSVVTDKSPLSNSLDPYVEFLEWTSFKGSDDPFDEVVAKRQTWMRFCRRVERYLRDRPEGSRLFWRVVPEEAIYNDRHYVISYDDNGPDKDLITDRRCHMSKVWKRYGIYARFAVG